MHHKIEGPNLLWLPRMPRSLYVYHCISICLVNLLVIFYQLNYLRTGMIVSYFSMVYTLYVYILVGYIALLIISSTCYR